MNKTIACLVICAFGYLQSEAQTAIVDSLRSLVQKINNIPFESSCSDFARKDIGEKINEYKANISDIDLTNLKHAVAKVHYADSVFSDKYYNYNNCNAGKAIKKVITNMDSLLKMVKSEDHPDSLQILKAILYVKNEFAGFVSLKLVALTDSNAKIDNPGIILNSIEPSIIPPGYKNDSTPVEIYIRPGITYFLTLTDSGHNPVSMQLIAAKDTVVTIRLKKSEHPEEKGPVVIKQSYWWIPAVLLGLVLCALVWKILSGKKKHAIRDRPVEQLTPDNPDHKEKSRKLEESIRQLNAQIKEKDILINRYTAETGTMYSGLKLKSTATKYFLSEMMMTAGPRKKRMDEPNADKDLGEDVCGFITVGDEVLVWLLDGTSDFYCLRHPQTKREYFSSRLLAQCIARELKSHFAERTMETFDKTMATILSDVKSSWLETIHSLPESEIDILKSNIRSGNFPECAATVLIASLSLTGKLIVYRSGDSKMFVYGYGASGDQKVFLNTTLSSKNVSSNDRVFFRLTVTEQDELDILHNDPIFEIVLLEKIQTIIGLSDGIGKVTEEQLKKEYPINSDAMRNEIIYQLQGTEDDKSLYIIEIKE